MILTFTGNNLYALDSQLAALKEKLNTDDFSTSRLYGGEATLEDIKAELSSLSLFSSSKLVVLEEPSKVKGFEEYLQEQAANLPESTTIVIVEPKPDKRKTFYKFLKDKTEFKELNKPSGPVLIKWVLSYAKDCGAQLSSSDASYLIDRIGDDQLLLSQEIQKLALYSSSITRQSINLLTEQTPATTIFELLDSAFSLNIKRALKIYNDQRLQKVEPEEILAMISWQLNMLAIYMTSKNLPPGEVASKSGVSPFALSKARQIASSLSFSSLKKLVSELAALDFSYKTSSLDLDEGLKNFIVSLGG